MSGESTPQADWVPALTFKQFPVVLIREEIDALIDCSERLFGNRKEAA